MATDVSSQLGPGLLLHMLHGPSHLFSSEDSPMMLSAAAGTAGGYNDPAAAASSSGTADSPMDAGHAEQEAAQALDSHNGLSLQTQEVAATQLKKACKAGKGPPRKRAAPKKVSMVCKVDGCGLHLGAAKAYYQRHRVCAVHLSSMCARVNGVDSRFCQQCGKFQPLEEFDADKRSCRARLKRHNHRRREQRHNRSCEFAQEVRNQAAQLMGVTEDDDGQFDAFFAAHSGGLPAPYLPPRFPGEQYPSLKQLPAGFLAADGLTDLCLPDVSAAGMVVGHEEQAVQEQEQYAGLGGMLSRWAGLDGVPGASPRHSKGGLTGDASGSAGGGQSDGTTVPAQHGSSPALSPGEAAAAAAAAAAAGGGVVSTPTSGLAGDMQQHASARHALDALRIAHSAYSTQSDWDEDSEEGGRSPQAAWQHHQQLRRLGQAGAQRLQGSRLRSGDSRGFSTAGQHMLSGPAALDAHLAAQLGPGAQALDYTPRAGQEAGFSADPGHLNPAGDMQQKQQWGGELDTCGMQGWEAALAAQVHTQQQQQLWGAAYGASCGGSGGGAGCNDAYLSCEQGNLPSGAFSGPMQQAAISHQRSAPAGLCFNSRSSSPAISAGGNGAGSAAPGPLGPSMLGPGVRGSGVQHSGALQPQWSLPAQCNMQDIYTAAAAAAGDGHHMSQQPPLHFSSDPGQLLSGMQQAGSQGQGCEGAKLGPMQRRELQQVLQGLMPACMALHASSCGMQTGAGAETGMPAGAVLTGAAAGQPVLDPQGVSCVAQQFDDFDCSPPQPVCGGMDAAGTGAAPSMVLPGMCMHQGVRMNMNVHVAVSDGANSPAASATAAAAVARLGKQVAGGGLHPLWADSQGASALREGLAGVALDAGQWGLHAQAQVQDSHMADAPACTQAQDAPGQAAQHSVCIKHSSTPMAGDPAGAGTFFTVRPQGLPAVAAGCAGDEGQHGWAAAAAMQGDASPTEFESADTAAAAATFEAQLAACCGNKESQEAVFKAWLDALLPIPGAQQQQQGPQGAGPPQAPPPQGAPQDPAAAQHAARQQDPGMSEHDLEQQQAAREQQDAALALAPLQPKVEDDGGAAVLTHNDVAAVAAAALHLVAQRAAEEGGEHQDGADGLMPEEDFRELLDLLLDA